MNHEHDPHEHGRLEHTDEPLDAAHQSLADALRSSFSVLKGIMAVLLVLYLVSNVRTVEPHEQALVLRLGRLLDGVYEPGLMWAFPYPIDEIVPLPTQRSNEILVTSHTFRRRENEKDKPLAFISRSINEGLNPATDGALLTADAGLVHVQWKVTFKFDDVAALVSRIYGRGIDAAEALVRTLVENAGIALAAELTAEEIIRTRVDFVQAEMRRRINERLAEMGSGVVVTLVEMVEPTPPVQIRQAFDETQRAENVKERRRRAAERERINILNEAAGAAHERLVELLTQIDLAAVEGTAVGALRAELDRLLETTAEGEAGKLIKQAGAYRSTVVNSMQSDVEQYRTLLPEYRRNPQMLINRLWLETKKEIFDSPGVTKFYRPPGLRELRLRIPIDPEERRLQEEHRLQRRESDLERLRPRRVVPVGPEFE